jgi:micrococcal nuclease
VRLELDVESTDRYDRTLAYVFRDDGLFVNAEMLRTGLARVSARLPLQRLADLRRAEDEAQRARRGIWGERPALPAPSFTVPRGAGRGR